MKVFTEAGKSLSRALDNTENWTGITISGIVSMFGFESGPKVYTIKHIPSGLEFRTREGALGFQLLYENTGDTAQCLGLIERIYLYRKALPIIRRLQKEELKVLADMESRRRDKIQKAVVEALN